MKGTFSKINTVLGLSGAFIYSLLAFMPSVSFAAASVPTTTWSEGWKKAGISPSGDLQNSDIYDDLEKMIYFIMAVGGFWAIGCLIFAGMRLSAAQGGNPQARTQGFMGIVMAGLGVWVIVKATDIAGWFAGFGTGSGGI